MTEPSSTTLSPSTEYTEQHKSLYERVMADPDLRHSYFHTTEAFLRANPQHRGFDQIVQLLDDHKIVYLYDCDTTCPRPVFSSPGNLNIGVEEIVPAIERLAKRLGKDSAARS